MAPSKKSTKTETPVQESAPIKTETKKTPSKKVDAPVNTETKKTETKKTEKKPVEKKTESPAPAPAKTPRKKVEKKEESHDDEEEVEVVEKQSSGPRVKRTITKDSFDADCTKFSDMILSEITKLRESDQKPKSKGIRLLRTLHKVFRQLHKDGNKLTKFKKNQTRKNNTSSGFLKPVKITNEMAKFLGWDLNKEYSRTQVTKEICDYIAKHSLNDPENKRNINCDVKLKTLLKYDAATAPKDEDGKSLPLTYFRLQQYLKHHFIKPVVDTEAELDE